jgi:hypothetical protein
MTDTTPLAIYKAWRAKLSPVDQTRWAYLLTDGGPLLTDVIEAQVKQALSGPMAGLEEDIADAVINAAVKGAVQALQAP